MPKAKAASKARITPKSSPKKLISKLTIAALAVVGIFLLVGGYLKSTMQKSGINEVREGSSNVVRSMPAERECEKVTSFALSDNCAAGSYQMAKFNCGKQSKTRVIGVDNTTNGNNWRETDQGRKSCKSLTALYNEAKDTCAKSCPTLTPTPTPTPTVTPTPTSTSTPAPTTTTSCPRQSVEWVNYLQSCAQYGHPDKYQLVSYRCGGETTVKTFSNSALCKSKATLSKMADNECKKNTCN